jgi:hypothetical protein
MLGAPRDQLPTRGPVDPEQPQLFTGPAEPSKEQARPRRVGDRGGRPDHGQQEPQCIAEQMSCAALALFPTIVAACSTPCGGLDTVAVQRPRSGMLVPAFLLAYPGAQGLREPLPVPPLSRH